MLTFPPGLAIDVQGATITLRGKAHPDGTKLLVNAKGQLVPRGASAGTGGTQTPPKAPPAAGPNLPLTVVVHGPGRITSRPSGISCPTKCKASFAKGTTVTLVDHQASNGTFDHWAIGCRGVGSCAFKLTAAKTVVAFFKGAPFTPPPAPTPTTTTTPTPPPPKPAATPGHYDGHTQDNEIFAFDISADGLHVTGLHTGQINQSCNPPDYYLFAGGLINWSGPVAANGTFTLTGGGPNHVDADPSTDQITVTGAVANSAATGTIHVVTNWTHNGTNYVCTNGIQTWTAAKTG